MKEKYIDWLQLFNCLFFFCISVSAENLFVASLWKNLVSSQSLISHTWLTMCEHSEAVKYWVINWKKILNASQYKLSKISGCLRVYTKLKIRSLQICMLLFMPSNTKVELFGYVYTTTMYWKMKDIYIYIYIYIYVLALKSVHFETHSPIMSL